MPPLPASGPLWQAVFRWKEAKPPSDKEANAVDDAVRDYAHAYAAEQTRELVEALETADAWVAEYISQMSAYTISDKARAFREQLLVLIAKHRGQA